MPLNTSPISRNIRTTIRLLGLDIEDLMAIGITAIGFLIIGQFVFPSSFSVLGLPMNWFLFFFVLVVGIPGLMIFKYGKPRGYLKDFLKWHLGPHSYSSFGRDSLITGSYIREMNDEDPKATKGSKKNA
jgi:hypothetical protein